MDFVTIVPNLDRRHDRWLICLGALLALDFPPRRIHRFSAHDGQLYSGFEDARNHAAKQFPDAEFIVNNRIGHHYYCWSWTWYDIMTKIADGAYGDYVLVLIDDCGPRRPYSILSDHLEQLVHLTSALHCIQFSSNNQYRGDRDTPVAEGELLDGLPYRRGITKSGDAMNLVTPAGAAEILRSANSRPKQGVPNWVFWHLARSIDTRHNYYTALDEKLRHLSKNLHTNNFQDGRYRISEHAPCN